MVMENIININEYNDLINESNIIKNEIEEIDKDIKNYERIFNDISNTNDLVLFLCDIFSTILTHP